MRLSQSISFAFVSAIAFATVGCGGSDKTAPPQRGVTVFSSPKHAADECPAPGLYVLRRTEGVPADAPESLRLERAQGGLKMTSAAGGAVSAWTFDGERHSSARSSYVAGCSAGEARIEERDATGTMVRLFAGKDAHLVYSWGVTGFGSNQPGMKRALYQKSEAPAPADAE